MSWEDKYRKHIEAHEQLWKQAYQGVFAQNPQHQVVVSAGNQLTADSTLKNGYAAALIQQMALHHQKARPQNAVWSQQSLDLVHQQLKAWQVDQGKRAAKANFDLDLQDILKGE